MLTRLHVRNYAIISELHVKFSDGLTIITGETGAGKSILIGALSLVLGKRADTSVLYDADEKCVVEAHFEIGGFGLEAFFEQNDLDFEKHTILRREINAQGKSRAFVNDTPVNLSQLKELASNLIDIHSQHEVLTLKTPEFRARFLDACADGGKQYAKFQKAYSEWNALKRQVEKLKQKLQEASADEDYVRFQLSELLELNLKEGEFAENQERLNLLENAEEIRQTLGQVSEGFSGVEGSILDQLRRIESELGHLARKHAPSKDWTERVKSSFLELEDVAQEIERSAEGLNEDPEELIRLQERVDEVVRLMTKHRKQSESELIEFQQELEEKLDGIGVSDEQLTLLQAELELAGSKLESEATLLSQLRATAAKNVAPVIESELHELGMPDATLKIELHRTEVNVLGQDGIDIQFTANKGQALQDISKVASGGELSRLMLSVKSQIAKTSQLPAIIFDEIDTGVSGDVANKVGQKIRSLSTLMQVLCITHLPQIASKADQHLYVYKQIEKGKTETKVRELNEQERVVEVAKMLSNANPTEAALTHAKNLLNEK
ncbi:MAG: DNA repair protein RecN [Flavobacteriales bacterium]|nr:DNA repair protein RecN [Flavobacteriales bacterium]